MTPEQSKIAVSTLAQQLASALENAAEVMTNNERLEIFEILDFWCRLCGGRQPCYCAPCYDE